MHGHTTPKPTIIDPLAARIACLSEEYLDADSARKNAIGAEISALISGNVVPLSKPTAG